MTWAQKFIFRQTVCDGRQTPPHAQCSTWIAQVSFCLASRQGDQHHACRVQSCWRPDPASCQPLCVFDGLIICCTFLSSEYCAEHAPTKGEALCRQVDLAVTGLTFPMSCACRQVCGCVHGQAYADMFLCMPACVPAHPPGLPACMCV